jgi:hypothetical protein
MCVKLRFEVSALQISKTLPYSSNSVLHCYLIDYRHWNPVHISQTSAKAIRCWYTSTFKVHFRHYVRVLSGTPWFEIRYVDSVSNVPVVNKFVHANAYWVLARTDWRGYSKQQVDRVAFWRTVEWHSARFFTRLLRNSYVRHSRNECW